MTLLPQQQEFVDQFFAVIETSHPDDRNVSFHYIAVKRDDKFYIIQGALMFNTSRPAPSLPHFESASVKAGVYLLSELNLDKIAFVKSLLIGKLETPNGIIVFPGNEAGGYGARYEPFHNEGLKRQARFNILTVIGGMQASFVRQPFLDWELRAAPTPYEGIQELSFEYKLGGLREIISVELIAFHVVAVDYNSLVSGTNATIAVLLAHELSTAEVTVGYRVFNQGRVETRSFVAGDAMQWTETPEHQRGSFEIEVPPAAVIQCFVSYCGVAQHFAWVSNPATMQNPRRAAYDKFDDRLTVLNDFLTKSGRGRDARDLEVGVAWLLWMLGFSVAHLGGTGKTQDAADLIATTPRGDFAVIECTTGLLKADNKLSLLVGRAEQVRAGIVASNNKHLRVLPVIVTSRTRAEVTADIEQAEKLGVLVMTKENLQRGIERTLVLSNADQIYEEALQAVEVAKAKPDAQGTLPLA